MFRGLLLIACLTFASGAGSAQTQPARMDPIAETLYPPDLLLNHANEIGLDEQQEHSIETQWREHRRLFVRIQQTLQQRMAGLGEILRRDHPDEKEAMAQLDQVLDAEGQIKRVQLSLLIAIRNQLTPEQQARAREIRRKQLAESRPVPLPEAVRAKMQQLQAKIRQLQDQGSDASAAMRAAQECRRLMQDGKPHEAEAALDRALAAGTEDNPKKQP
jgi:Spy/CpxP family protein refolding chaperone